MFTDLYKRVIYFNITKVMKKNFLELFVNKLLEMPSIVKQFLYLKLSQDLAKNKCEEFLRDHKDDVFVSYSPIITFNGENELNNKSCGFDNNFYCFLNCCLKGYSILEISSNIYFSIEEIAKYIEFSIEQGYIKTPKSVYIKAMIGFLSGKIRIGEYFNQCGVISLDQLQKTILKRKENDSKMFGEILVDLGYIKQEDLSSILNLKEESTKRIILDYNMIPNVQTEYDSADKKYEEEIKFLKNENIKLKQKMLQLLDLVKKNG